MSDARLLLLPCFFLPSSFLLPSSSSFFLAGPHLPALDRSESSPDLICQLLIARVWALWASPDLNRRESERCGFNRRESERCGPRQTSTGESLSADLNRRESERCGPRRTSARRPEPQPARVSALWASPALNRSDWMPDGMSEDMPDRMLEDIQDRMSEDMPDRMPEDIPDRMPDRYSR